MDGAYNCLLYLSKVRLVNVTFEIGVVRTDDRRTVSGIDRFPISMAMGLRARSFAVDNKLGHTMAPLVLSQATTEVNKLVRYLLFKFFFHFVLVHNNPSQNI